MHCWNKDTRENTGDDYFGITPLADYISKMVMKHNNMLVFPTMADKRHGILYLMILLQRTQKENII